MFDGLFLASTVAAVSTALKRSELDPKRPVCVVGDLRLARALTDRGHAIVTIAPDARGLKRLLKRGKSRGVQGAPDALPIRARSLAALVGVGAAARERGDATVLAWSHSVVDGGAVILVDKAAPADAARVALCAGLTDIEQRAAGRGVVTSGVVTPY